MRRQKHKDAKTVDEASCFVRWLLLTLLIFSAGCREKENTVDLNPGELTILHSISRETILLGDQVQLTVTAYYPTNGILELPEIGRQKDIVLLKRNWETVPREDGLTQTETHYSITSFRLGEHEISNDPIICRVGDQIFSNNFPNIILKVESSLGDEASTEIADIKPVKKLPGRIPPWLWVALLTALTAFLVGTATSRLWKNRKAILPALPPVPPHIIAFRALEALKNKGLLERDECNPFYTELSLILRTYLEGRFQLNAPDETTEEIVEETSRSPELTGHQRNILQEFMRQADMVKFAKGHPDRTTMEAAFTTTKQFVEETRNDQTDRSDQSNQTDRDECT